MDPLTGFEYEHIDERLMEMIHRGDPGWFLLSFNGLLYFLTTISNARGPELMPPALHFEVDCPKEVKAATYIRLYNRWAASSPFANHLKKHMRYPAPNGFVPNDRMQRALFEARVGLSQGFPLERIKRHIQNVIQQPVGQPSIALREAWNKCWRDEPETSTGLWNLAAPYPKWPPMSQMTRSPTVHYYRSFPERQQRILNNPIPKFINPSHLHAGRRLHLTVDRNALPIHQKDTKALASVEDFANHKRQAQNMSSIDPSAADVGANKRRRLDNDHKVTTEASRTTSAQLQNAARRILPRDDTGIQSLSQTQYRAPVASMLAPTPTSTPPVNNIPVVTTQPAPLPIATYRLPYPETDDERYKINCILGEREAHAQLEEVFVHLSTEYGEVVFDRPAKARMLLLDP